jgi:hypothetical protein
MSTSDTSSNSSRSGSRVQGAESNNKARFNAIAPTMLEEGASEGDLNLIESALFVNLSDKCHLCCNMLEESTWHTMSKVPEFRV